MNSLRFRTLAASFPLLCSILATACSKPDAISLPRVNGKLQIPAGSAQSSADSSMAAAQIVIRNDCTASNGASLEFCLSGIPVSCEKKSRGEFCTQFSDSYNARMWGPY